MTILQNIIDGIFIDEDGRSEVAPLIECATGVALSVQAGRGYRSHAGDDGKITHVEVQHNNAPKSWSKFQNSDGLYDYVPVGMVEMLIEFNGGECTTDDYTDEQLRRERKQAWISASERYHQAVQEVDRMYSSWLDGDTMYGAVRVINMCDAIEDALESYSGDKQMTSTKKIVRGSLFVSGVNCHLYGILAEDYTDYYEDEERGATIHIAVLGNEFDLIENDVTGEIFIREYNINEEVEDNPELMEAYDFELVDVEDDGE